MLLRPPGLHVLNLILPESVACLLLKGKQKSGETMHTALQINFIAWLLIGCAIIKGEQVLGLF
jgi:hypothetical protein